MKILHVISSGGMYGAEAVILNLSHALESGPHASVLAVFDNVSNPNLQLHEAALKRGLESHTLECRGQMDRATVAAIRALAAETGADVVHAHGFKADLYAFFALRSTGVALVSTCHTWYDNDRLVTWYGRLDRLALRGFARVVAVSEEVRQRLLKAGVREERIRTIRNGIDLRPFDRALRSPGDAAVPELDQPERELVVGLVGRLAWEKGIDLFLQAAACVLPQFSGVRFVVVGEGPDREKLERSIDGLGVRQSVTMLGRRTDMPDVYASLDIMVSSSRQEGLPMAILEGMASSLPLVATSVGAVPTVVEDGVTGLLVPAENVERLAAGILELLGNRAMRQQFGAAARRLIEQGYSAGRMAEEYLRVYEEAIAVKQGRAR